MGQPNPYAKATDFTEYQTEHASAPFSGALLDAELVDIELNLQGLNANIALLQRDDGELANEVVGVAALGNDVLALIASEAFTVRGSWATTTLYAVGDLVEESAITYLCLVEHTSGTFATDLAAVKWVDMTGSFSLGPTLASIEVLTGASDRSIYFTGTDIAALYTLTAAGRALLDDANAAAQLTTLGGTATGTALFLAASASAGRATLDVQPYDIRNNGCECDGSTDDYTLLQDAIDDAKAAGGGTLYIPDITAIGTTLVLKTGVNLIFAGGAYLKWIGAVGGTCVETQSDDVVQNCVWSGLTIDTGASFTGVGFKMHSAHNISADVIRLVTTGSTSKAMTMYADSTGGESSLTKRNVSAVHIGSLVQHGVCGTLLEIGGVDAASGYDGNVQVVTANTIDQIFGQEQKVYGLNIIDHTDNNSFPGYSLFNITAVNATGVQIGGTSAINNVGVYGNSFGTVAVNTFASYAGRVGMRLGRTAGIVVGLFYQYPVAEGGALDIDNSNYSYDITLHRNADNYIEKFRRLETVTGGGFNSSDVISLADDAATSISVAGYGTDENICFIATLATNGANLNGVAWCKVRRSSGVAAISALAAGSNFDVTTGALAGTTGVDTKVTLSAHNDGKLYIENRSGAAISVVLTISAFMQVA